MDEWLETIRDVLDITHYLRKDKKKKVGSEDQSIQLDENALQKPELTHK